MGKRAEDLPLDDTPIGMSSRGRSRRVCPSWPPFRQAATTCRAVVTGCGGAQPSLPTDLAVPTALFVVAA
jgi:hypothetical protein